MAKKQQPQSLSEQLQELFDSWDNQHTNGGSDPFNADGGSLNVLRNRIIYIKQNIEKAYPKGDYPEIYHRETPPEVSQNYVANVDGSKSAAFKALSVYKQNENLQYIIDNADTLPPKIAKQLCVKAVVGYAEGLEQAIKANDFISMRRHRTYDHYLESFKSCAAGIRKFQLKENILPAEKIATKPIQIREKKEYNNMEKATLQVQFPQEKLEALEF